jgi:hypothetical protein
LRQHSDQYQLSRLDDAWFKGLVFSAFNNAHQSRPSTSHIRAADYTDMSSERPQEQPSMCPPFLQALNKLRRRARSALVKT